MSKHHKKNEEINNEPITEQAQNKPIHQAPTLDELNKKIIELNEVIFQKDKHIEKLQQEIQSINNDYVSKITEKTNEANATLKNKLDELSKKAFEELSLHKKYAIEKQAENIINIINQFELALSHTSSDEKIANYQNGFKMFLTMFKNLLSDLSIHEILVQIGDEFDPKKMECIEFIHHNQLADNKVAQVVTKGYYLHDHLIKPAVVRIVKKKN
jgi:molecular chaperone GrpE